MKVLCLCSKCLSFQCFRVPSSQFSLLHTCTSCPGSWRHPCFLLLWMERWFLAGRIEIQCSSCLTAALKENDCMTRMKKIPVAVAIGNAPRSLSQVLYCRDMVLMLNAARKGMIYIIHTHPKSNKEDCWTKTIKLHQMSLFIYYESVFFLSEESQHIVSSSL